MARECRTDILIVGGGTGGVAAAMAATAMGAHVILTEPTAWLGGQLTSQAVPPDEHRWIEQFGCTRRYRAFRDGVRAYYRAYHPLTAHAIAEPYLNPGDGTVSRLCHEPRVAVAVIEHMLAPARSRGLLTTWHSMEPEAAHSDGDRITSVTLRDTRTNDLVEVHAAFYLDASELGDLFTLAGIEHVTGAESQTDTGEPHAVAGPAQPENIQGFTHCLAVGYDRTVGADHGIERPSQYARWRNYVPNLSPAWPGRMLDWTYAHPIDLSPRTPVLLPEEASTTNPFALWTYRRVIATSTFTTDSVPEEVTIINWPQNDFLEGSLLDPSREHRLSAQEGARQLSLSLLYWMQHEAPRPDGGVGYPGLRPRGDVTGTPDGLAMAPYVRESRRLLALCTVTELHVGASVRGIARGGAGVGEVFTDRIGIGSYRIDLHPSTGGDNYIDIDSLPFTIPLGALLPIRMRNVIAAAKNIGTTHVTNGCYRLHPVEWNIGEAAGLLASHCLAASLEPHALRANPTTMSDFQSLCRRHGLELDWPVVHAT